MANPLSRLFILCAVSAALCLFAQEAFAARASATNDVATDEGETAAPDVSEGESSPPPSTCEPAVTSEPVVQPEDKSVPVEFSPTEEPITVVRTVQPEEPIEVHLSFNAGTPFVWKVLGGTESSIPSDQTLTLAPSKVLQPVEDIGVKVSEITLFYSYQNDPKYKKGFVGGPMASKCTITPPEKPGVYRVAFGFVSVVDKTPAVVRVVEIHVAKHEE